MKKIKLLLCILISCLCLYLIFRKVDLSETWRLLSLAQYPWLLAATGLGVLKSWLTGFRWRYLSPTTQQLSTRDSFHFYAIGVMTNMTLPFRVGDLLRARLIAEALSMPSTQALGTIASEHILDFTMLCCLLLACFSLYSYHWPIHVLPVVAVFFLFLLFLGATFYFWKRMKKIPRLLQLKERLLALSPKKLLILPTLFRHFYAGLFQFGNRENIFKIVIMTTLIWLAQALWIYALLSSLGLTNSYQLGIEAPLVLAVLMGVAVMLPSSPGYIGTFHLIVLLGLTQMGVSKPEALSFAILAHIHAVSVAVSVGLYSLWKGHIQFTAASEAL